MALNPTFIANFDPSGNILPAKNRTTIDINLSSSKDRYFDTNLTFVFLLLLIRTSHRHTNCEKAEPVANGAESQTMFIFVLSD